jgi:hypothetical protein
VAIIPARPRHPRDKAKVETAVQIVERHVLAPLRHRTFFALEELHAALRAPLDALNARPFQKRPGSRQTLCETLDRPALRPLPPTRYESAEGKRARVNIDDPVCVEPYGKAKRDSLRRLCRVCRMGRGGRARQCRARGLTWGDPTWGPCPTFATPRTPTDPPA